MVSLVWRDWNVKQHETQFHTDFITQRKPRAAAKLKDFIGSLLIFVNTVPLFSFYCCCSQTVLKIETLPNMLLHTNAHIVGLRRFWFICFHPALTGILMTFCYGKLVVSTTTTTKSWSNRVTKRLRISENIGQKKFHFNAFLMIILNSNFMLLLNSLCWTQRDNKSPQTGLNWTLRFMFRKSLTSKQPTGELPQELQHIWIKLN